MNKYIIYISTLLILALLGLIISFTFPIKFLINFAHDDSFYYIKIADNLSKGFGSTFDQVNMTNGYHPLWMIVLTSIFYFCNHIFNLNSDAIFRIVFILHLLLCSFTVLYTFHFIDLLVKDGRKFVKISFLLFALVFVLIRDVGMESQIVCLLFAMYMFYKARSIIENSEKIYIRVLILILIALSRTDYIYSFIPAIIISDLLTERTKFCPIEKIILIISPLIVVGLFHLYNTVMFGSPNIISGNIVSSFPQFSLTNNLLNFAKPEILFNQAARMMIMFIATGIILLLIFKKEVILNKLESCLFGISLGSIIFVFIHLLFNKCGIREWYLTFPLFIQGLIISVIISRSGYLIKVYIFLLVICFIGIFYSTRIINSKYDNIYDYALKIKETVSNEEKIFSFDWMGILGFFSERKFICGDGFVNSFEYLDYLKKGNLNEYLKKYEVKYYSTYTKKEIDLSKNYFIDVERVKAFDIDEIKFPIKNILISEKYYYFHTAKKDSGYHYLIRFPEL